MLNYTMYKYKDDIIGILYLHYKDELFAGN